MIKEEKEIILHYAKKFKVSSISLFGLALKNENYNDINLGIDGIDRINPGLFFKFYGKLSLNLLSKPVDLIDLSERSLFSQLIKEMGVKHHG